MKKASLIITVLLLACVNHIHTRSIDELQDDLFCLSLKADQLKADIEEAAERQDVAACLTIHQEALELKDELTQAQNDLDEALKELQEV